MKISQRAAILQRIAARQIMCDCETYPATHLDSGNCPECDRCQRLNQQALQFHERTRESMELSLPYEERVAIEEQRAARQRNQWRMAWHKRYYATA